MKICFKLLCFLYSVSMMAQQQGKNCGQGYAYQRLFEEDPSAKARLENIIKQSSQKNKGTANLSAASSFTIPVVFHVLHKGGSENISDAQINDAVAILNRDFRKMNADTTNIVAQFKPLAADCNVEFKLATIDDNGKCTNGITRHYDNRANWTINFADYVYTWNPSKYLNIYVVRSLPNGTAGYTYLPGTVGGSADAIVILHGYIGTIGTGNVFTSRALTHEVGHWFNLMHVWGSTNNPGVSCGDDGVGDTPLTKGHGSCNLGNAIDCTPGIVENIQNYMEYSYCTNMYTIDQRTRMHNCLNSPTGNRNNLSTNANLIATGVINPMLNCAPKAEYLSNTSITCVGSSLSFVDQSYNAPIVDWLWSSPLASNSSTLQYGILSFSAPGIADVKLKVSNAFGSDSITKSNVTVLSASNPSGNISLVQSFETGNFPDNNWIRSQPQFGSPFVQTFSAAATGTSSIWINNYFDNPNGAVSFYTPAFNLQNSVAAQLSFKYAYAQQNGANNDRLRVYVSTNCGTSWAQLYSVSGTSLSTTGVDVAGPFTNPAPAEWKTENVNVLSFSSNDRVYFKFEFTPDVNGAGNNIFIDDINLNSVVGLNEFAHVFNSVNIYPNPFNEEVIIENTGTETISSVKIFDISMRKLKEIEIMDPNSKKIILGDLKNLSSGVYFMELKSANGSRTVKLIRN